MEKENENYNVIISSLAASSSFGFSGFRFQVEGCRVWGLGFWVEGLGFWVEGFGLWVLGCGFRWKGMEKGLF